MSEDFHDASGYEKSDVNVKMIVIPSAIFAVIIVLCLIGVDQFFKISKERMYFEQVLKPESQALKELHQKEHEMMSNYKMMDKSTGMVQIPIERAMELEVTEHAK